MTIKEKALFYKTNKHLPNIEPARIIESNGLKLKSTMQGMIINIEENALDVIDLYNMIIKLQKEVEQLKKENEILKNH